MGLEKLGMSLAQRTSAWVKATGKTSILQTKPIQKVPTEGLRLTTLKADIVDLENSFKTKINSLLNDKCIQAGLRSTRLSGMQTEELYHYLKTNSTTKGFEFESFHNDGLQDYIGNKNLDIFKLQKNEINELVEKYLEAENKFYSTLDDLLFPKSTNTEALKLEEQLANMGVSVRLMNNAKMGEGILKACKKMNEAGIKSFPKYRVAVGEPCSMGLPGKHTQEGFVLLGQAGFNSADNVVLDSSIEGITFHETAHVLHKHLKAEHSMPFLMKDNEAFQKINPLLEKEVSIYSKSNINEALSEIFTGLMNGRKFSNKIMQFYKDNGGYITPNLSV